MGLFDRFKKKDSNQVSIDLDEMARESRRNTGYGVRRRIEDETPEFYRAQYRLTQEGDRKILSLKFEDHTFVDVSTRDGGVDVHELKPVSLNGQSYKTLAQYVDKDSEKTMHLPSDLVHTLAQRQYSALEKKGM